MCLVPEIACKKSKSQCMYNCTVVREDLGGHNTNTNKSEGKFISSRSGDVHFDVVCYVRKTHRDYLCTT